MSDDGSVDMAPPEVFGALRNLFTILSDPKRTHEKLVELEARIKEAKKAEHRLGTVRERDAIAAARERQELDERRGVLAKKGRELLRREAAVDAREKTLERAKVTHHDSKFFGGLAREFVDGDGE